MRPARPRRLAVLFVAVSWLAPAGPARAGNGIHPRTPVEWPEDTPCMTVFDRSQSTVLHFEYDIPYEDTELTMDEVADSRRHQFVAFCLDNNPQEPLPTWLSWKDVDAAVTVGLVDPMDVTDEDVLETSSIYKNCFARITGDDERRPITFAEVMKGVDWDGSTLAPGPHVVQGYTWEPAFNVWWKRPGVVHVVDGPDLAAVGPAAALSNREDYMFSADGLALQGCVRAMPGATLSGYWSLTSGDTLDWKPFAEDVAFMGEAIDLHFMPPPEAVGEQITLRVDVTDPMQRSFTAHALNVIAVLPGSEGGTTTGCSDTGSFLGGESCGDGSSGDGGSSGSAAPTTGSAGGSSGGDGSGDSGSTGVGVEPMEGGCGCTTRTGGGAWGLFILVGLGLRRRKRGFALGAP